MDTTEIAEKKAAESNIHTIQTHWEEKMNMTHRQESVQDKNHVREAHVHAYKYEQTTYRTLPRLRTSNVGHMDEPNVEKGAVMFEYHYGEGENKVEAQRAMPQTPIALAMYGPSPRRSKSV